MKTVPQILISLERSPSAKVWFINQRRSVEIVGETPIPLSEVMLKVVVSVQSASRAWGFIQGVIIHEKAGGRVWKE